MIAVSYLKSKLSKREAIEEINDSKANLIHVDLMDGKYVSNNNFTIASVIADLKDTTKLLDIHLMVKDPLIYLDELIKLNVWCITFHLDSTPKPLEVINFLRKNNIKVGLAINPLDDIHTIDNYLDIINYVLVMSVNPGEGGQTFKREVLTKIAYLQDKKVLIGIDGGINAKSIKLLKDYHVDNIVSGSFICMQNDYDKQITILKDSLNN